MTTPDRAGQRNDGAEKQQVDEPSRRKEYLELRAEGILPADIMNLWRMRQAGDDLRTALCERFAFERGVTPESIAPSLPPEVVLNIACVADQLARSTFSLQTAVVGVREDEIGIPTPSTPFEPLDEQRRARRFHDPSNNPRGAMGDKCEVALDVEPICAIIVTQLGLLDTPGAPSQKRHRDERISPLMVSLDALTALPIVRSGEGRNVACAEYLSTINAPRRDDFSGDVVDLLYSVLDRPERIVIDVLRYAECISMLGGPKLAASILRFVPDEVMRDSVADGEIDLKFASREQKSALLELARMRQEMSNVLDTYEGIAPLSVLGNGFARRGLELSGSELAVRAVEERITHDPRMQARVAEHILHEHIEPEKYRQLSESDRSELKQDINDILARRVTRRAEVMTRLEELAAPIVVQRKQMDSLERARYELKCFRLHQRDL